MVQFWERIPREQMITVSRRKFMRIRAKAKDNDFDKLRAEYKRKVKELEDKAYFGWKQAEIYQHQHLTTMDRAAEWMEKYNEVSKELAELKQSMLHLV